MLERKLRPAPLPYENATSGKRAVQAMQKTLERIGASKFGYMEDFDKAEVMVQFPIPGLASDNPGQQ